MLSFLTDTKILGIEIYEILLWFLLYGVIGWIFESTLRSIGDKKFVNRGFLFGPFIPIYAFGITGFVLLLNPLYVLPPYEMRLPFLPQGHQAIQIEYNYFLIMIGGMVIASALEYIAHFAMQKLFHQTWWDYTPYKFNIKGRICMANSVSFGLLSIAAVKFIHPLIGKTISDHLPKNIGMVIIIIAYIALFADIVLSNIAAAKKKKKLAAAQAEEVKEGE